MRALVLKCFLRRIALYDATRACRGLQKNNERILVFHVSFVMKAEPLHLDLKYYFALSCNDLLKDFKCFMANAIKLCEALNR